MHGDSSVIPHSHIGRTDSEVAALESVHYGKFPLHYNVDSFCAASLTSVKKTKNKPRWLPGDHKVSQWRRTSAYNVPLPEGSHTSSLKLMRYTYHNE
jgi:hypothetical protein